MKQFYKKITPIWLLSIFGTGYLLGQFLSSTFDYNIVAYIIIFVILFSFAFFIDRFLVRKVNYKALIIAEIIFIALITVWYLYSNRHSIIKIETSKSYFYVIYNDEGLKAKNMKTTNLFNKTIEIKTDSIVYVDKSLDNVAQIDPPLSWNYSFSTNGIDTVLNGKNIRIQLYAKDIDAKTQVEMLKAELFKMNKNK